MPVDKIFSELLAPGWVSVCAGRNVFAKAVQWAALAIVAALPIDLRADETLSPRIDLPGWRDTGWLHVGPQRESGAVLKPLYFYVLIDPDKVDRDELYCNATAALCRADQRCEVHFWSRIGDDPAAARLKRKSDYYLGECNTGEGANASGVITCRLGRAIECQ